MPDDYATIQMAINASVNEDEVLARAGTGGLLPPTHTGQ
jgi:hypothetical protein